MRKTKTTRCFYRCETNLQGRVFDGWEGRCATVAFFSRTPPLFSWELQYHFFENARPYPNAHPPGGPFAFRANTTHHWGATPSYAPLW